MYKGHEMKFKQYGYTPDNMAELVAMTGLSNVQFCKLFDVQKATFYKYKNGDITMAWHQWNRLVNEVKQYLSVYYIILCVSQN